MKIPFMLCLSLYLQFKGSLPIFKVLISAKEPLCRAYPCEDDLSLGACLKRRRLDLGWLQEGVAKFLEVSIAYVGSYELNKRMPRITERPNIVKFLKKYWREDGSGTLANRCLSYRSQEGISIYELSKQARMSEKTIIRIEKGSKVAQEAEKRLIAFLSNGAQC